MYILKVGGGKAIRWEHIAEDLKGLKEEVVVVHGANYYASVVSEKLGIKERFIMSPSGYTSRYTDEKAMEVLTMTYAGLVNKKIVSVLRRHGINALGMCGADGGIWLGKKKNTVLSQENGRVKVIRDSQTGNVTSVNKDLITVLVRQGYTPVITIPAVTVEGELINVDNDRAVAVMARDLAVTKIVMLFEAPGLLSDRSDESTRIARIGKDQIDMYIGKVEGRMKKKLLGIKDAFSYGATDVYLGDGRIPHPITRALDGAGTVIH